MPSGEQTHPHVTPGVGLRHRTFELTFTLAQAVGHSGMQYTSYRPAVAAPAHAHPSCSPTQPAAVTTGSRGEVKRIALRPAAHGWCRGRYNVTIWLQRTPTCGPPLDKAQTAIACPVTASSAQPAFPIGETNTGETHFTVR